MSLPWRLNKLARKKRGGPPTRRLYSMHRRSGAVGGDAVAQRVETGRRILHKGVTTGDGNPLGTLVAAEGRRRRMKKIDDSQYERTRANARTRLLARASGANLKVSRAAEKLAHLISNGSFNNIPRHPPLSLLASLACLCRLRRAGYVRINRALFPRRARFSPARHKPGR